MNLDIEVGYRPAQKDIVLKLGQTTMVLPRETAKAFAETLLSLYEQTKPAIAVTTLPKENVMSKEQLAEAAKATAAMLAGNTTETANEQSN